jgi:hypothetical protein
MKRCGNCKYWIPSYAVYFGKCQKHNNLTTTTDSDCPDYRPRPRKRKVDIYPIHTLNLLERIGKKGNKRIKEVK